MNYFYINNRERKTNVFDEQVLKQEHCLVKGTNRREQAETNRCECLELGPQGGVS